MINDALLNNKKLSLPNTINIKFQKDLHKYLNSKLYLGLYILFSKQKVERFLEVDSKNYHQDFFAKNEGMKIDFLIIKYNGIKALNDYNFQIFVNKCLILEVDFLIFYISKELDKNKIIEELNLKLDDTFIEEKKFSDLFRSSYKKNKYT